MKEHEFSLWFITGLNFLMIAACVIYNFAILGDKVKINDAYRTSQVANERITGLTEFWSNHRHDGMFGKPMKWPPKGFSWYNGQWRRNWLIWDEDSGFCHDVSGERKDCAIDMVNHRKESNRLMKLKVMKERREQQGIFP